jgi:hypothetical protein
MNSYGKRPRCKQGHKFVAKPKRRKDGSRICRLCAAIHCARYRAKRKAA